MAIQSSNISAARRGASAAPMPMTAAQLTAVAGLFAALSEVSRLRVLQVLREGPTAVGELVGRTGMKQANVSKQLRLLLSAGVVARRQDGNRAVYAIAMPVVYDLCELVCRGIAKHAAERAAELGGKPPNRPRSPSRPGAA